PCAAPRADRRSDTAGVRAVRSRHVEHLGLWEIAKLARLGRIAIDLDDPELADEIIAATAWRIVSISSRVTRESGSREWSRWSAEMPAASPTGPCPLGDRVGVRVRWLRASSPPPPGLSDPSRARRHWFGHPHCAT